TGELPFRGTKRMLLHQVLHDEPSSPRRLNEKIPRDLETITLKAMAKEPSQRYPTAQDLADDLRRFMKGGPITARPGGRAARPPRWCRRNPLVASLTAAFLLSLIAGTAVSIYFAIDAGNQAEEAKRSASKAGESAKSALQREKEARAAQDKAETLLIRPFRK